MTKKQKMITGEPAGASGFWCYIGPSVGGVIDHGAVFPGSREEALRAASAAVERLPPIKQLLVSGACLAEAVRRVEEPGSALFAASRKIREMGKEGVNHA